METDVCLLDIDYFMDGKNPIIRIWGKTKDNKSIVILDKSFKPYFYILPKEGLDKEGLGRLKSRINKLEVDARKVENVEYIEKKMIGKKIKFLKIIATNPTDVPKFRDLVKDWEDVREEYEYGISFYKRYLIDKYIVPMGWVKVKGKEIKSDLEADLVVDAEHVEKLDKSDIPNLKILAFDIETAEEKIIMISLVDNKGFKKNLTFKKNSSKNVEVLSNESEMIKKFTEIIQKRDPDIICGYNSDRFDFQKMSEKYNTELILGRDSKKIIFRKRGRISSAQVRGRIHVDVYNFIENILSQNLKSEILTLDRVSKEILGESKKQVEWKDIENSWKSEKNLEKIAEYCMHDSELTLELAKNLLPQMYEMCRLIGHLLFDISRMTYSQLVESLLLKKAFEVGEIMYNRPKFNEVRKRRMAEAYEGGYVHLPKEGIHNKIAVFDFTSLYPSIIVSHNISPETLDCGHDICVKNHAPDEEHYFCTEEKGFITNILIDLIKKRNEIKNKMKKSIKKTYLYNKQFALKILANAFYGYYGYAGSRWYSRICAQSITSFGRFYIKNVIKMAEKNGLEVLYGDTDSLFLRIENNKQARDFLIKVNKTLPGIMNMEFKGIYKRGIFIETKTGVAAKKKYALLDKNNKLVMRGMETRRRDWAKIAKDTQEKVLFAVLKDKSPGKAVKIVNKTIQKLKKGGIDLRDLTIYTQITRPLNEYEQIGPHVRAAKKSLKKGRIIKPGSVISYVITKGLGSISERAEPVEDAKNYSPEYYIHHQVIPAALRILSGLGISEEDLIKNVKKQEQFSLEKYIK